MTENITINATTRHTIGKASRRLDNSELAAVVYGTAIEAQAISVPRHEFEQILVHEGNISSKLIEIKIDGGKPVHAIVKDLQTDAVKGTVRHVDFWAVNMRQHITTTVPVHFEGEAPGLKTGGVFMHNLTHINVEALPDKLPEAVFVDISRLEVGDSVHVSDIATLEGVTFLDPADEIVASVVAPTKEEEVVTEEAAEPEVIGATAKEE